MISLYIKEYVVIILAISASTFCFRFFFKDKTFFEWGRLLFLVITAAFFSKNFFIFGLVLFVLLKLFVPKKSVEQKIVYYLLLLPLVPCSLSKAIPFPGLEQLFTLTYPRMLNIFILLPIFVRYFRKTNRRLFSYPLDRYVVIYFLYIFSMGFRDTTMTNAFRSGFDLFIDFFVLYFAISRSIDLDNKYVFEQLFRAIIFSGFILALISIYETVQNWHLFTSLPSILDSHGGGVIDFRKRLGFLRAFASFYNPIPFGMYLGIIVGYGIYMRHLSGRIQKLYFNLIIAIFLIAIFCTVSRGPLVLLVLTIFIFLLLAKGKAYKIIPTLLALFFVLIFLPITDTIVSTLPFIGKKAQKSVDYRKVLWTNSMAVVKKSPITGSNTYIDEPEIQDLKKIGGGLKGGGVDFVNSYLKIMLQHGTLGLSLFGLVSLFTLVSLWKAFSRACFENTQLLGKMLFSTTISFMIALSTVSMISFLPFYFWCLIGLSQGYRIYVEHERKISPSCGAPL